MGTQVQHLVRNTNTTIAPGPPVDREAGVAHPRQETHPLRPITSPGPATLPKVRRQAARWAPAGQAGHPARALARLRLFLGSEWLAACLERLLSTSCPPAN